VVEHRHLDDHPPHAFGRQGGHLERRVGTERRAEDDRLVDREMVQERDDLLGEDRRRVARRLVGPIRQAVPEQVDRNDVVAALRERAASRSCMRWDSSRPCTRTTVRAPEPYSV